MSTVTDRTIHAASGAPSTGASASPPLLEARSLSKSFDAVRALRGVSLTIQPGEVRGLVGGNGSGKSTFVKILAGYHEPDEGTVLVDGEPIHSTEDESRAGCRFVHQDLALIPEMTVAENLGFAGGRRRTPFAPLHPRREAREVQELLDRYDLPVAANAPVGSLSAAARTMVALIRALHMQGADARLLVLDEVTATLPPHEIKEVFAAIRRIAEGGAAVLFVSHKVQEVLEICDTVTVFRDGVMTGTVPTAELDEAQLVERIVGRPLSALYVHPQPSGEAVALRAADLAGGSIRGVDLELHQREIVGVTSIDPAQPSHLLRLIYGLEPHARGSVAVDGEVVRDGESTHALMARGVSFVANRTEGGVALFSVRENLTLNDVGSFMRRGVLSSRAERSAARSMMEDFQIRPPHSEIGFAGLSGGNQQKAVLAKSMRTEPRVLLLDDPTQGVDVGAKAMLYRILQEAAAGGLAVLIGSTDIDELCGICHRVVVLKDGRVSGIVEGESLTPDAVLERCYVGAADPEPSIEEIK